MSDPFDCQAFHELCMDYRGAQIPNAQAAYEALQEYCRSVGSARVVQGQMWADGMERAAELIDEEANSARSFLSQYAHKDVGYARLEAIVDNLTTLAKTVRAFKNDGLDPLDDPNHCGHLPGERRRAVESNGRIHRGSKMKRYQCVTVYNMGKIDRAEMVEREDGPYILYSDCAFGVPRPDLVGQLASRAEALVTLVCGHELTDEEGRVVGELNDALDAVVDSAPVERGPESSDIRSFLQRAVDDPDVTCYDGWIKGAAAALRADAPKIALPWIACAEQMPEDGQECIWRPLSGISHAGRFRAAEPLFDPPSTKPTRGPTFHGVGISMTANVVREWMPLPPDERAGQSEERQQ